MDKDALVETEAKAPLAARVAVARPAALAPSARLFQGALVGCVLWATASLALGMGGLWVQARGDLGWGQLEGGFLLVALLCAAGSYVLRLARWHLLAARLAPHLDLKSGAIFGGIGFALTVTPGRAGEALKLYLLHRRCGVPLAASAPILLVEKATEGLGFLALAALGVALLSQPLAELGAAPGWLSAAQGGGQALGGGQAPALLGPLGLGLGLGLLVLARASLGRWAGRALRAVAAPWARLVHLRDLAYGSGRLLAPRPVAEALVVSVGARLCDAAALYWVARAFGLDLPPTEAMAVLGSAGLVGGLSLLPGGVGAVEVTMVGLLAALGHDLTGILGLVLVTRVLIFWQWVALGLGLAVWHGLARETAP
ncbi:MAG: flippase-like domain-containing protein [Chloroflexi bacterium]|nr:flippase-like domain-containing protein [Chloroflexota bacterium]